MTGPVPEAADAATDLRVAGLWFRYGEGEPVLRGIDLSVARGEFVALLGANGSGKTTLSKHFNGLLRPFRGEVWVGGRPAAGRSVGELAHYVGYLFQHPEQQIFGSTVREEVAFGPRNLGLSADEVEARLAAVLERFDLTAIAGRPPAILSYGGRRRVTLASLAALDPQILVLDEPTVGLDAGGLRETFAWLEEMHAAGRTVLLVTHDMEVAARYAQRVIVLRDGVVWADGVPADLFQQAVLLSEASLALPPVMAVARALRAQGIPPEVVTVDDFVHAYENLAKGDGR
ncbi:MAG: ABC transporter ATP-binding protein [Anaerolineae bacterium]